MFTWAVDPHSFFADPDPAVFLNADPDPAALKMRIRIQLKTNFFAFFLLLFDQFFLPDPDPHIKSGSRFRRENECGSIHSPGVHTVIFSLFLRQYCRYTKFKYATLASLKYYILCE